MFTWIKSQIATVKEMKVDHDYGYWGSVYYAEAMGENKPIYIFSLIEFFTSIIWMNTYGKWMCRWFGHGKYFHDESYGNPESGASSGYCDRCGFNYYHQMY